MFKVMGLITLDIFTKVNHSKQTHFPWADNIIMEKSNNKCKFQTNDINQKYIYDKENKPLMKVFEDWYTKQDNKVFAIKSAYGT